MSTPAGQLCPSGSLGPVEPDAADEDVGRGGSTAALASTFLTSLAGAVTYGILALDNPGTIAPDWILGLACGLGDLVGGYLGACLQSRMPDRAPTLILGVLAIGVAALYAVQAIH